MTKGSETSHGLHGSDGFTLIEMLIVTVVFTLVLGGALTATVKGLSSYNTMSQAFEREKSFGNFVNEISYKPTTDTVGIMQRNLSEVTVSANTLTLKTITGVSVPVVVYYLDGNVLKRKVDGGAPTTVLTNIDTAAGGISFSVGQDTVNASNTHRWIKLVAHMTGRSEPYVTYLALRNEGDLL